MRFYVSSGLENIERVTKLLVEVKKLGHVVTYDWTTHGAISKPGEALTPEIKERMKKAAAAELAGVATADILIVLLSSGRGRGTHVELGAALMCGLSVLVVMRPEDIQDRQCIFYYSPETARIVIDWSKVTPEHEEETLHEIVEYAARVYRIGAEEAAKRPSWR